MISKEEVLEYLVALRDNNVGEWDDMLKDIYNYINQLTLDTNVEEAILSLDMRLQSEVVNTYVPDIDLEVVKQALSDKDEEIQGRKEMEQSLSKMVIELQSKLNVIEEVVETAHNISFKYSVAYRIKQIIGGTNEKTN